MFIQVNIKYIILSFIFSIVFVFMIPWTEIKQIEFADLINYTDRATYLINGGTEREYFGISQLFSEFL